MRRLLALFFLGLCFLGDAGRQPIAIDSRTAQLPPEVRLRKIHLVRPDLIPYPINYEVYC